MGKLDNALNSYKVPNALYCNSSAASKNVIECNWLKKNASWEENKLGVIPKTLSIQNLTVKSKDIHVQKLARYIFPKNDRGPTIAGQLHISPVQCLEYSVNLCLHRLPPDLKQQWDQIAGRDSKHPEISKLGIQSTKYDLRMRANEYKKEREKTDYIESLRNGNKHPMGQKHTECEGPAKLLGSTQECGAMAQGQGKGNVRPELASQDLAANINISK